jgi:hypothetical protein
MNSEAFFQAQIRELQQEITALNGQVNDMKTKLVKFNALEPGKWVAWNEGYDQAHQDIEYLDPTQNPYRKDMNK